MNVMMKFRFIAFSFLMVMGLAACDLIGDIDDIKPENVIEESVLIRDESSANLALRGIYELWRDKGVSMISPNMGFLSGALSGSGTDGGAFTRNEVKPETSSIADYYVALYRIVNYADVVMEQLQAGKAVGLDEKRKDEMIGECKFHRAMAHFFLLRAFGQFYDATSPLGIVLVEKSMEDTKAVARSSVADVYQSINDDLDDAIKMAPEVAEGHYYISQMTAKALKARVLLYQKKYHDAAVLAKDVLDHAEGAGYIMETDFANIFKQGHESSEAFFAPYAMGFKERFILNMNLTSAGTYTKTIADAFVGGAEDGNINTGEGFDQRFAVAFATDTYGPNRNGKYPLNGENTSDQKSNSYFYLRLAETYLIHAEAAIRDNQDYGAARTSLKVITDRAGYDEDYVNTIPDAELLEMIRQHKWLELVGEAYEEWFDLVRYHKEGDLDIKDIKPTVTSDAKLIFPIPQQALAGNNALEQNPL